MKLDKFSNPIYTSDELFMALYKGHELNIEEMQVQQDEETSILEEISYLEFKSTPNNSSIEEYDKKMQSHWFIPDEYKKVDIKSYCLNKCTTAEQKMRVIEEMKAFESHNMLSLLRWLKYFVDTCLKNDILWGVGRGSSTASYILFLLGVHQIDSIKYKLDWKEFLR